jgi:hypothetical protein
MRIDTDPGHGLGKPVSKLIDERADVLAFLELTPSAATDRSYGSNRTEGPGWVTPIYR